MILRRPRKTRTRWLLAVRFRRAAPVQVTMLPRHQWRTLRDLERGSDQYGLPVSMGDSDAREALHALGLIVWVNQQWELTDSGRSVLRTGVIHG